MLNPKKYIATRYEKESSCEANERNSENAIGTWRLNAIKQSTNKISPWKDGISAVDNGKSAILIHDLRTQTIVLTKEGEELRKKNSRLWLRLEAMRKEITEERRKVEDLTASLRSKDKEMVEIERSNVKLTRDMQNAKRRTAKISNLSLVKDKKILEFESAVKKLQEETLLLRRECEKSKLSAVKDAELLENSRLSSKRLFNSSSHRNFVETYAKLIDETKKLYDHDGQRERIIHCPAIAYVNSIPDSLVNRHNEDGRSFNDGPSAKRMRFDSSAGVEKPENKYYSIRALKDLVMGLEMRHSEDYQLWRNVLWSLNQYGRSCGYNTLEIADCFSKRSTKYENFENVKRTFYSSDGSLSLQYLINIQRVYTEGLGGITRYVNSILPGKFLPLEIIKIDTHDRRRFRLTVTANHETSVFFLIPNLCVITDEKGKKLCFLKKKITSKNSTLASLCSDMENGFEVSFKTEIFVFRARNDSCAEIKLHKPLKPETVIVMPGGKRSQKSVHLSTVHEALRAEAIRLLSTESGKKFGDDEDDCDIVKLPDEELDAARSDIELVEAIFDTDPSFMSRYRYSGKTIYYCQPETNVWRKINGSAFECHLLNHLRKDIKLTRAELKYISTGKGIANIGKMALGKIEDSDFAERLDSNGHLFATRNKIVVTSSLPAWIRDTEKEDLVAMTSGWTYDRLLAEKHKKTVRMLFKMLLPDDRERDWLLSFFARLLNGERTDKLFVIVADKADGRSGKTILATLLRAVFGDYHLANTKMIVSGGNRDANQFDGGLACLCEKRLLVAAELHKTDTLNASFIKGFTDARKVYIRKKTKVSFDEKGFPVKAGLVMICSENDIPTFDKNDQDFVKKMVVCPLRSRFLSVEEIQSLVEKNGERLTNTHIANEAIQREILDYRSATLDLLMEHYQESLLPIPQTMQELKSRISDENYDWEKWLDAHLRRDNRRNAFVTATEIMNHAQKTKESQNPRRVFDLKAAMALWAEKNNYTYKARHAYQVDGSGRRVENKSVILNSAFNAPLQNKLGKRKKR